ncbi:MAG: hypothetical protein ACLUCH_07715, partial [Lachnospirales bacterium]
MSNKIALDGIVAYALAKKMNSGNNNDGISIKNIHFNNEKLIITMIDNTIFETPFSDILKHNNKVVLDNLTVDENNKLLYDNELICDLSEAVKNIILDDNTNELIITFGDDSLVKIPLEPFITDIVSEILANNGYGEQNGSMFLFGTINTIGDLNNVVNPQNGQTIIVEVDSSKSNQRSLYTYKNTEWVWVGSISANRDFNKEPINLNTEIIGTITDAMIPNTVARVSQLHNHNNKNILDELSQNSYNELLYKGKKLSAIKITDKDNIIFSDVTSIKISNFLGQLKGNLLELKFEAKSTDLKDMPKVHSQGKVLVSNQKYEHYELKSIEEITDLKENFTTTIKQQDWGNNDGLGYYQKIITHNLNSSNLIVAFYDRDNNVKKEYEYTILNDLEISVKSNVNDECRIVINCSQGTAKYKGTSGGISDHIHSNLPILNAFNEDRHGNLLYNGSRIFTNFNPLVYKRNWNQELLEDLSLLVNYQDIFNEQDIQIIVNSELVIENKSYITGNPEIDKLNEIHLIIEEDNIIVLDVKINPQDTQKYIIGINPSTKVFIKGYFSGNLCINYFNIGSVSSSEGDNLSNYYNKTETNNLLNEKV